MVVTAAHSCATSVLVGGAGSGFLILPHATLTGCNSRHLPTAHHRGEGVVGSKPAAPTTVWVDLFLLNVLLLAPRAPICQKNRKTGRRAAHSPLPS